MTREFDKEQLQYFASKGSHISNKTAQKVGPVIEELRKQGRSTARDLVEAAKDENSPAHSCFEWDDQIAGMNYRDGQAVNLIRAIVIMEGETVTRAFHPIPIQILTDSVDSSNSDSTSDLQHYLPVSEVKSNPQISKYVLRRALKELISWKNRYQVLREYLSDEKPLTCSVYDLIDQIEKKEAA